MSGLALSAFSSGMEENRKKREEGREKRANDRQLDSLHFYTVPEGRDGAEKGRALGERTEKKEAYMLCICSSKASVLCLTSLERATR